MVTFVFGTAELSFALVIEKDSVTICVRFRNLKKNVNMYSDNLHGLLCPEYCRHYLNCRPGTV